MLQQATVPVAPPTAPPVPAAMRTALCAAFALAGWLLGEAPLARGAFVVAYVAGALGPSVAALQHLRDRQLSVDLLMVLAALGAAIIGEWAEGAVLLFLFTLSGTLEAYAMYRTTRSIESLIQLRPREAALLRGGEEVRVPIDELAIGDVVRVRPGERFPVDGAVTDGETWADEATLTGESTPIHKVAGSPVFAGTINGRGSVLVRMTHAVADSTLERIVRLVREAQAEKTPAQQFVEAWEQPYVLSVLAVSFLTFAGAWLWHSAELRDAFYHSMVILVVASPCAVVISSPAVVLSAITRAARAGVLFKGGYHLVQLGRVDIMAFDKTGTITAGKPSVTTVWTASGDPDALLQRAAAVEQRSEHHLAEAVVAEAGRHGLGPLAIDEFESHTGLGVHAHIAGRWVGVGREPLFESHDVAIPDAVRDAARHFREQGQTALLVISPGEPPLAGVIALADQPRPGAHEALAALKRLGVRQNVILTGDHAEVARLVAREVGADAVRAGLLPEQKVIELRRLMEGNHCLAMVGDGVNDAPALATAQVGIAMGRAGTDVALDVADVVLMRDDLRVLPVAVWLSRRARQRIRQNLTFAFGMIALLLASSFLGLPLWLGVLGHEGSTVLVVLNGLRLLGEHPPKA